jgi:WD40 repeat protein
MRVIEAFDEPVRAVAVSPDGRFLAAATGGELGVWDWVTGEPVFRGVGYPVPLNQLAFTADGNTLVIAYVNGAYRLTHDVPHPTPLDYRSYGPFSGGVAVSPDGRTLVATRAGRPQQVKLEQWELPGWRPKSGIDYWSPFERLAFSPDGQHVAGINHESFELRFANSFGLNSRQLSYEGQYLPARFRRGIQRHETPLTAFLTFPRHSETVVFGWDAEFRVMETRAGNVLKRVASPGEPFADAAFVGSGRHLATVDGTGVMRLWSTESWEVAREYDWAAGGLTCVAATADGLAGVCGTDTGRIVVFDVDE